MVVKARSTIAAFGQTLGSFARRWFAADEGISTGRDAVDCLFRRVRGEGCRLARESQQFWRL